MKLVRRDSDATALVRLAMRLKAIDYELMDLVAGDACLNLQAQGRLVDMQRRLRTMRYDIETAAGAAIS